MRAHSANDLLHVDDNTDNGDLFIMSQELRRQKTNSQTMFPYVRLN